MDSGSARCKHGVGVPGTESDEGGKMSAFSHQLSAVRLSVSLTADR